MFADLSFMVAFCALLWASTSNLLGDGLQSHTPQRVFYESECFIVLLIDAPKMNFDHFESCCTTLMKTNLDAGGHAANFGHVWIALVDRRGGNRWEFGYSGEKSPILPGYFAGISQLLRGNCSQAMARCEGDLDNPIRYLFATRSDGYLQRGNGAHLPSCAVGWRLERDQLQRILRAIMRYPKGPYSLTSANCVHFGLEMVRECNWHPDCMVTLNIPRKLFIANCRVTLWRDVRYSRLQLCAPNALEKRVREAFSPEEIQRALNWYSSWEPQ